MLTQIGILWGRNMKKFYRVPALLFFALFQPILFMVLFSQVFGGLADLPGFAYDSYLQFLLPTIVGVTAINSAFGSGMGMVQDIDDGMLDKFLLAPIRRSSILLGKVTADATRMVIQVIIITLLGLAMGARIETGIAGVAMMIALAVAFGVAWAGISNVIALRTKNAEITQLAGILVTFPVMFLSTGFMPDLLLPDWLQTVAAWNPITYLVEALRALVNTGWDWTAIWKSFGVTGGLAVVTLTAATMSFRKAIN